MAAAKKLLRLRRLYSALSMCNKVVVRSTNEGELFQRICEIAVQSAGMKMAWIGTIDPESSMLRPIVSFGDGAWYIKDIVDSSIVDIAIRENQPFWCQDFLNDPATAVLHELGALAGFAASASLPLHREGGVVGVFTLYSGETNSFDELARNLLLEMADDISFALDNIAHELQRNLAEAEIVSHVEQLRTSFMSTVEVAMVMSEMRDPYTTGHARRVAEIAVAIGTELGFNKQQQDGLRVEGHLHDIGKVIVPLEILSKPCKLNTNEFQLIQGHAQAGYDVLKNVVFPWPVAQVALQHHERMDGTGYPQGLKGEEILPDARIMIVADVVEAMFSHRPYRPGLGIEAALAEIERGRGTAYAPDEVDACLRLFREKCFSLTPFQLEFKNIY